MGLRKLPYKGLDDLFKDNKTEKADAKTAAVLKIFKKTKQRGWITKSDLIAVCRWKSPRAIHHIQSNRPQIVKTISRKAIQSRNEEEKMRLLVLLKGVSIPMASSILMFLNPRKYGVIDIRVWQVLYKLGIVKTNARGTGFSVSEWLLYLDIIRVHALKNNMSVREAEYILFQVHEKYQWGPLY